MSCYTVKQYIVNITHCYEWNVRITGKRETVQAVMHKFRVPTAQGKQEQLPKKFPVRENTGNLEILPKHREFVLLKL